MKKFLSIFILLLSFTPFIFAEDVNGYSSIILDYGQGKKYYKLGGSWDNRQGWQEWHSYEEEDFNNHNFGIINSLALNGHSIVGWDSDQSHWIASKLMYCIYPVEEDMPDISTWKNDFKIGNFDEPWKKKWDEIIKDGNDRYVRKNDQAINLYEYLAPGDYNFAAYYIPQILWDWAGKHGIHKTYPNSPISIASFTKSGIFCQQNTISFSQDENIREVSLTGYGDVTEEMLQHEFTGNIDAFNINLTYDAATNKTVAKIKFTGDNQHNYFAELNFYDKNNKDKYSHKILLTNYPTIKVYIVSDDESFKNLYIHYWAWDKNTGADSKEPNLIKYNTSWVSCPKMHEISTEGWKSGLKKAWVYEVTYPTTDPCFKFLVKEGSYNVNTTQQSIDSDPIDHSIVYKISRNNDQKANIALNPIEVKDLNNDNHTIDNDIYGRLSYTLSLTYEQASQWNFISCPFDVDEITTTYGSNILNNGEGLGLAYYNTANRADWVDNVVANNTDKPTWTMLASDGLSTGKGYIITIDRNKIVNDGSNNKVSIKFSSKELVNCVLNDYSSFTINLKSTYPEYDINSNWHLIGSGLYDIAAVKNIQNIKYIALPDGNMDYTYHYISNPNPILPQDQALLNNGLNPYTSFFVQYGGKYSFSKAAQQMSPAPLRVRAKESLQQYYINLAGEDCNTNTAVFLEDGGSDGYTVGEDFINMNASNTTLYSVEENNHLSFNHRGIADQYIKLGGYIKTNGQYTISLASQNINAKSVVLFDSKNNTTTDLLTENYTFNAEKGSMNNRFDITITLSKDDATKCEPIMSNKLIVYGNESSIYVEGLTPNSEFYIYNMQGQCCYSAKSNGSNQTIKSLPDGIYMIKNNDRWTKFIMK